jgi:hypothetical protein
MDGNSFIVISPWDWAFHIPIKVVMAVAIASCALQALSRTLPACRLQCLLGIFALSVCVRVAIR